MNAGMRADGGRSLKAWSRAVNRPAITLLAIALALILGSLRLPFLQYLRPVGDFYVALLQICVLPFLLAAIPLAVRSAMASGSAPGVVKALLLSLAIALLVVAGASVVIPGLYFGFSAPDEQMINNIGAVLGRAADSIDVEFAIDARNAADVRSAADIGIFALIPTNIFASLSANDSVRVLVFAAIFGVGMALTERESGHSIFDALKHIQDVCTLIFDWFSLLVPVGIVALIAPQVALLGPDVFSALALFAYGFIAAAAVLLVATMLVCAIALRASPVRVAAALLKPVMLGASTRNSLICIPLALDTLKSELGVPSEPCDLYVPIGFAAIRFGTILYFIAAALFMGQLMGRPFSGLDLGLLSILAVGASFATLGVSGLAALAPLTIVLRPFGLSYEVAVPLMVIIDPLAEMVRTMLNVAINCTIPVVAAGRGRAKALAGSLPRAG